MDMHEPDSLLQVAIRLEELGKDLYESLASLSPDPELARLCESLSRAEAEHVTVFAGLRELLAGQGRTRAMADDDLAEARRLLKDTVVPDRAEILRALETGGTYDVLTYACELERHAISFYRSLARYQDDTDLVLQVLREEESHLRSLETLRDRGAPGRAVE